MINFSVGDEVYLISGSPALSVIKVEGNEITCRWKNKRTNEIREFTFESYTLTNDSACYAPGKRWDNPFNKQE